MPPRGRSVLVLARQVMEWDDVAELQWWQALSDADRIRAQASPEVAERLRLLWAGPGYGVRLVVTAVDVGQPVDTSTTAMVQAVRRAA